MTNETLVKNVKDMIRTIPDFPKEGILFRDITTAIKDAKTMKMIVDYFVSVYKDKNIDYVAAVESRGFIFGMPIAYELNCGFVPIRKPNKLPAQTLSVSYELEYGTDKIEIHKDAIEEGKRVLLVDDLLATGGTACAGVELIKRAGGIIVGAAFVIELEGLKGREKMDKDVEIVTMVTY